MRRLLLINPNATQSMTEAMLASARATAPEALVEGWTSHDGPPVIEGPAHGDAAVAPMLELVRRAQGVDAILIGCFDDTGLAEANAIAPCPVIGIGQAAFHVAALRSERFSVVTTLPVSVPVIEANIRAYGLGQHLARVRASGLGVADTEELGATAKIIETAQTALSADGCDALILGCGGMSHLAREMREALPVPVHDGVECAVRLALAL